MTPRQILIQHLQQSKSIRIDLSQTVYDLGFKQVDVRIPTAVRGHRP